MFKIYPLLKIINPYMVNHQIAILYFFPKH